LVYCNELVLLLEAAIITIVIVSCIAICIKIWPVNIRIITAIIALSFSQCRKSLQFGLGLIVRHTETKAYLLFLIYGNMVC
jgi:hypothetical protein